MTIRKALPADAPAMARLIVDTWFATHDRQIPARALQKRREEWGYAESERGWRRSIRAAEDASSLVLVATNEDGQIVGIVASDVAEAGCAEVGALYVDVAHQRSGIGRRLLEAIVGHHRDDGIATLRIAVLAENRGARSFYERLGGQASGSRDHEDGPEVVYSWDLTQAERNGH